MNLIKKKYLFLLSIASGLLLTFGWPANGFPLFLFIGFVPILIIEDVIFHHKKEFHRFSFFLYAFIAMIIWNSLTTYWIYYSTAAGVILAILLNSLFMSITLSLFHYSRKTIKHHSSYFALLFLLKNYSSRLILVVVKSRQWICNYPVVSIISGG
jgi:apolipoprotein N-acyltransferase